MASQGLRSRLDMSLPAGAPLSDEVYARRHAAMRYLLAAHIPFLVAFGIYQSVSASQIALETSPALLALLLSTYLPTTRARAVLCSLGLVTCSFAVIHMSRGSIEAQLHMFVILAFVALYQDWAPFIATIIGDFVIYLAGAAIDPIVLFRNDHAIGVSSLWTAAANDQLDQPFLLAAIGCAGIGALGVALLQLWNQAEERSKAAAELATQMDRAELTRYDEVNSERKRSAEMLTQLARRNQGLLARQVANIVRLPAARQGDVAEVTSLAQRMRRNADSLLVLAGEDAKRMWTNPEDLEGVLRESLDSLGSSRGQLSVTHAGLVNGGLVRDLGHLVTEIIDNALTWTPVGLPVQVRAGTAADGRWLVLIDDHGPGLSPEQLTTANERLHTDADVRYADVEQLGLQVVSRLAARHGLDVSLVARAEGGLTAVVWIPATAITASAAPVLVSA